jgi:capsid assembly protease
MKNIPFIAARMFDTPMLIEPSYARFAYAFIGNEMGASQLNTHDGQTIKALESFAGSFQNKQRRIDSQGNYAPYSMYPNGVAVIDIEGTLVHKNGYLDSTSGMQGYDGIAAKLDKAANDPAVKSVLLDCNSPGGEVSGCADLGKKIADFKKPINAIANDQMTSAMYWVASQCDSIYATSSSRVGSIGVLFAHQDISQLADKSGVVITLIQSGNHKVDGNPYQSLPESVRADIQSQIDSIRVDFANAVASGRGDRFTAEQALATEAKVYSAKDAKKLGLIDAVSSFDAVIKEMGQAAISGSAAQKKPLNVNKGTSMANENELIFSASDMEKEKAVLLSSERANASAVMQEAVVKASSDGALNERQRIGAIIGSDVAKGRETLANHIAFKTSMSVDDAASMLAASEKSLEAKAASTTTQVLKDLANGAAIKQDAATAGSDLGGNKTKSDEPSMEEAMASFKANSSYMKKG